MTILTFFRRNTGRSMLRGDAPFGVISTEQVYAGLIVVLFLLFAEILNLHLPRSRTTEPASDGRDFATMKEIGETIGKLCDYIRAPAPTPIVLNMRTLFDWTRRDFRNVTRRDIEYFKEYTLATQLIYIVAKLFESTASILWDNSTPLTGSEFIRMRHISVDRMSHTVCVICSDKLRMSLGLLNPLDDIPATPETIVPMQISTATLPPADTEIVAPARSTKVTGLTPAADTEIVAPARSTKLTGPTPPATTVTI